jgi:predicted MFS family arabinose efflux permease
MVNKSKILADDNYKLLVLLAAGSLTTMAGGVVAPVLPDAIEQLHLDPILAGNLVSMHCLTIALFSPILGILADKITPTRVLVPSLILYSLFGTAGAFMPEFWSLLATRALLGAASGGIAAASLGLLGQMYEGEKRARAIGFVSGTLTITGMLYPLFGGIVGANHWQFAFYLYPIGIPLAGLAALSFSPKLIKPDRAKENNKLGQLLMRSQIWIVLLILGLASISMYSVIVYAPLYLKQTFGIGAELNGVVLAARALGAAIISAFGAKFIADKLGSAGATGLGFGLMALTLITIPSIAQFPLILIAAIFFGVGFGLVLPNLYNDLANLAPVELRSSILAAGTGAGFLGQFLSPIVLGPILLISTLESVFYAAALVSLGCGLLLFWSRRSLVET